VAPGSTDPAPEAITRSALLRRSGVAAAALVFGGATGSRAFAGPLKYAGRELAGSLTIAQWRHVVPEYDVWFDGTWAKAWGEQNDVQVDIDHLYTTRLPALAATEVKAQQGHDIFGFQGPPAAYEDQVIDHAAIVNQIESAVGEYGDVGKRSTYNPKTKKYFGVADYYVPAPVIWRHDLWNAVGESPASWDHVRLAAPKLKAAGHPIGIGQSNQHESNVALISFLMCCGSFIQDESNALTIDSKKTVQAVQFMADLYKRGQESEIFSWTEASNNQCVFSGKGSMIVNPISAIRVAESLQLPVTNDLWLWPIPRARDRLGLAQSTGVYSIWKFAKNRETAEKFIADLCIGYRDATTASKLFNFPTFPGAFPTSEIYKTAAADTHRPLGKYSILTTIASRDTHNIGYPGYSHVAVDEALNTFLIPKMFAAVSQGRMTAAESVRTTAREMKQIWAKWKAAGKI
jgi:multiple sugar transport system substrate-binding protein